jgi:RNA polymerase sigma factor (sigma-70 family)
VSRVYTKAPDALPSAVPAPAHGWATAGVTADSAAEAVTRLDALYRAHFAELRAYLAHAFGAGPPEPEDLAQSAFARFASVADRAAILNPRAFLFRTARNLAIDERRRAQARRQHARDVSDVFEGWQGCDSEPESVLWAKEREAILRKALHGMNPRRRAMLLLNRIDGITCTEIGRRAGVSEAAVRKQIDLALRDCVRAVEAWHAGKERRP